MRQILLDHIRRYPLAEPQDFLKLVRQSALGGAHMGGEASLARLEGELRQLPPAPENDSPALEPIGGGFLRLNLRALGALALRPETVDGLFHQTCAPRAGSTQALEASLCLLETLMPRAAAAIAAFRAGGCPPVRHSDTYRRAYRPAYRLVPEAARTFLPLFQRIDALLCQKAFVRIAIDGHCASGKSTLGALLRDVYGANLFHMDDYFLPFARKTPERLAEPGGNVDYERFFAEVAGRPAGAEIHWRAFDCAAQALGPAQSAAPAPLTVVEGSYSLHPALRGAYDLKVFLSIDPERQSARILARNGPEKHRRFVEEWIPLENAYFRALDIRALCDLAFDV